MKMTFVTPCSTFSSIISKSPFVSITIFTWADKIWKGSSINTKELDAALNMLWVCSYLQTRNKLKSSPAFSQPAVVQSKCRILFLQHLSISILFRLVAHIRFIHSNFQACNREIYEKRSVKESMQKTVQNWSESRWKVITLLWEYELGPQIKTQCARTKKKPKQLQ